MQAWLLPALPWQQLLWACFLLFLTVPDACVSKQWHLHTDWEPLPRSHRAPAPAEPDNAGNGQGGQEGSRQGWRGSEGLQTQSQREAGAAGTALTPPRSFQHQAQAETHNIIILVLISNSMSAPRGCPHSCTGGSHLDFQPVSLSTSGSSHHSQMCTEHC